MDYGLAGLLWVYHGRHNYFVSLFVGIEITL